MELSALGVESSSSVPGLDSTSEEKGFPSTAPYLEQKQNSHGEGNKQLLERSTSDCASLVTNGFMPTAVGTEKEVCLQGQNDFSKNDKHSNISSRIMSSPAESIPTDISLRLSMVRQKTGLHDHQLQGELRGRLRLLENDSREVMAAFSELSARLLSIHSDQDRIVVTFKTFEEIWKFTTYYTLGFVNHCMENLLLDQSFWLSSQEKNNGKQEEARIEVSINEESLHLMYRGLLMQEGTFFVLCSDNLIKEVTAADTVAKVYQNEFVTEDTSGGSLSDDLTLDNKVTTEPLIPFHQWFLKVCSDSIDFACKTNSQPSEQIATGSSLAVTSYESAAPEEISFQKGDKIEIIGYFIECMPWFIGRHVFTGQIGFVKTTHVIPDTSRTDSQNLDFLEEEEKLFLAKEKNAVEEDVIRLVKQTLNTEVFTVYRIDGLEQLEFQKPYEHDFSHHSSRPEFSRTKKVKEFLMKCKDSQLQLERTVSQEKDFYRSSNKETIPMSEEPRFSIHQDKDDLESEVLQSLLLFLNSQEYVRDFKNLYDFSFPFLSTTFYGYSGEDELVDYFRLAREAAKKANMPWALMRLCFLLGRLSVRKLKFSQARVYFEEAMGAMKGDFGDLYLVIALYTNLTAIYLKQKNKEKSARIFDKAASLLVGIPNCVCSTDMESDILRNALKRTVVSRSKHAEARACFLLVKHYTKLKQYEEALPFLERLQLLNNELGLQNSSLSVNCYFKLGEFYSQKYLPHIVLSCVRIASSQGSGTLISCLRSIDLVMKNAPKLYQLRKAGQTLPSQIAPYLRHTLASVFTNEQQKLYSTICLGLAELYRHHRQYGKAIVCMEKVLDSNTSPSAEETINHLVLLAWLYILHRQNADALVILNAIADSFCGSLQQLGVIYNMIGIALKRVENIKEAAENYYKALQISKETKMTHNQAVVLSNFGMLCLDSAATNLAERYFIKAMKLFSRLPSMDCGRDFIQVLLQLGSYYVNGTYKEKGLFYYEWAFLVAMETNNLESQLQAIQLLCQFYSRVAPDGAQCVIYNEYKLSLARKMSDKVLEGQILETISQLYLSLGTERAYRSALEYTKRSLGIFIDLQKKEKEAYAWLQAGKIYYILRQNELVDLYIQVAQDAALYTGDPNLGMELFEAAGDIFFNGAWEKEKAVSFYRDRALPLAVKIGNKKAELRLCNKLVELLLRLKAYEEGLEYAKVSLSLSVNLGDQLNERIAYHRLAAIHHRLGQCELAEHFYLKALSLCSSPLEFDEETLYYVKVYLVLGDIIFYDLKDPFDAAGYYHLALAAAMDLGNKKAQLKIYTRLAIIYHHFLVDREMSLFFYQKARTFATELNVRRINLAPDQYCRNAALVPLKDVL
ncbi:PREDICTED: SH3 domain and tetratricopeptide repeat-containing protein 1 isoform X1 [Gavialis gangeticus]|uniref:SH3 domain and tetratricopeptide repeat-containing protein 1 isoform X1 n=2 Tax=Gavialis gangeticus TaxID=94835 RepID=UPI00092F3230|nr:PREDICTED: SH3 domain and tetratricopeptide repeat-containing protein 1 isoform X1 [Gavialis gangeticus]XP_019381923.1 PREDICTED: SH3 domain and tetratricopeptide repeat-containing protein 1 isoform X1 [Gavialis gangeticus]XP_019381924.1 PREDICTED: SH3 domain and tetratricopeptide repeat-containing protein 1 isoform X1 [Gavialis gangeticus]XP_019381926.1 PREDICTED: SH3 domain and tetratricopeptide repeat-containing protein 1 isoform X1 [Gavialis gangeticus]